MSSTPFVSQNFDFVDSHRLKATYPQMQVHTRSMLPKITPTMVPITHPTIPVGLNFGSAMLRPINGV